MIDAGSALAIVAALIGGGVLEVLLSPAWAQVAASASVGACRDWESNSPSAWDTCETWRSIFLISSSTAFFLDILALLLTVGGKPKNHMINNIFQEKLMLKLRIIRFL